MGMPALALPPAEACRLIREAGRRQDDPCMSVRWLFSKTMAVCHYRRGADPARTGADAAWRMWKM